MMNKRNHGRRLPKAGLIAAVLLVASMAGAFAGNLWSTADSIASDSASLVPAYTSVNYTETTADGQAVLTEQALIIHDENRNDELTRSEYGEDDVFAVIGSFTDGLAFSPFADAAADLEYEATGATAVIDGVSAAEYSFEYTIDENQIAYDSAISNGTDVDVEGIVWISENEGYAVKAEVEYSIYDNTSGNLEIAQVITYDYNGESWMPVQTVTTGSQVFTERDKTETVTNFTLVETYSEFFAASGYAR